MWPVSFMATTVCVDGMSNGVGNSSRKMPMRQLPVGLVREASLLHPDSFHSTAIGDCAHP